MYIHYIVHSVNGVASIALIKGHQCGWFTIWFAIWLFPEIGLAYFIHFKRTFSLENIIHLGVPPKNSREAPNIAGNISELQTTTVKTGWARHWHAQPQVGDIGRPALFVPIQCLGISRYPRFSIPRSEWGGGAGIFLRCSKYGISTCIWVIYLPTLSYKTGW